MSEQSPADKYVGELKLWGIRAVAVLLLSLLTVLMQRFGVPIHVDAPPQVPTPMKVVIQPGPDKSDPFTGAKAFAVPVTVEDRK